MSENAIKIKSMTAFAKQQKNIQGFGLVMCELKSVNSKILDINIRASEQFSEFENIIRGRLTSKLTRGKIDCFIRTLHDEDQLFDITNVTSDNIRNYLELYRNIGSIAEELAIKKQDLIITDIIKLLLDQRTANPKLPNKFLTLSDNAAELLTTLLDDVLCKLDEDKSREGKRLKEVLVALVDKINAHLEKLSDLIEISESEQTIKLKRKLHKIISNFEISYNNDDKLEPYAGVYIDSQLELRVAQEIAIYIAKMDVSEELARLKIHIDETKNLLNTGTIVGRKLDFLMQELTREANTLAAKSVNIEVRSIALDLKLIIEQMREQIQNVE